MIAIISRHIYFEESPDNFMPEIPLKSNQMKNVILADKQDITKAGILFFLENFKEAGNIVEADNKKELLTQLSKEPESIIIMDYPNFDFSGIEDMLIVSLRFKHSTWVLFPDEISNDFLKHLIYNTTNIGILFKNSGKEEINAALSLAFRNKRYICSQASNQLLVKPIHSEDGQENILTPTEKEILKLIAIGKTSKEIAQERFSSIHTITTHRKNIFRKLEVNSVYEATKYAIRAGIIDPAEYYI